MGQGGDAESGLLEESSMRPEAVGAAHPDSWLRSCCVEQVTPGQHPCLPAGCRYLNNRRPTRRRPGAAAAPERLSTSPPLMCPHRYQRACGLWKPRFGVRMRSGVCPPSKPSRGERPVRAFWPLCPRPDVLPVPLPMPRPTRLGCTGRGGCRGRTRRAPPQAAPPAARRQPLAPAPRVPHLT